MSSDFRLPSLAQHFDPPKGYIGHFGWMVGFSADASFMNDATERFTGLTKMQRTSQGRISLVLFLNDHNLPITMQDVPGVAHLPFADLRKKPCGLVHAKVAILGFRRLKAEQHGNWCVRLLVSTGNWTRQTLEESLDLAWSVDVYNEQLPEADDKTKAACADIKAASNLMRWLCESAGGFFDIRLLQSKPAQDTQKDVDDWIDECVKKARGATARFFVNTEKSLLTQLPGLVENTDTTSRNYLALGSGFYEGGDKGKATLTVPQSIIAKLKQAGLLTTNPKLDLFVNSKACQAVASAVDIRESKGERGKPIAKLKGTDITVRSAKAPEWMNDQNAERKLHAKFLFSANYRENSIRCNSAWVYFGSGNLTNRGFMQKMGVNGGNLEAGVVFGVDGLIWEGDKKTDHSKIVTNLLPIHWEDSFETNEDLQSGESWKPEPPSYFAPPVAWLVWHDGEASCELRLPDDASNIPLFTIVDAAGSEVQQKNKAYHWTGSQPQQVHCRWQDGNESREGVIPVMDAFGRIAAVKLPPIETMEDVWLQLANFPNPPEVDDPDELDGSADEGGSANSVANNNGSPAANYPVRQMMELVENIASKQTEIPAYDWPLWCRRLEQTLVLAKGSKAVEYFTKDLRLNPLAPLRHASFRPDYAEDGSSDEGKQYEEALERIESSWDVSDLAGLGDGND